MRLGILTAGIFLGALVMPAMADGCGDALDCHPAKPWAKHRVVRHTVRPHRIAVRYHGVARYHDSSRYYDYEAASVVREGRDHGAWRVAPDDGQVPMTGPMSEAMPMPCGCAPMAYGPPAAYGPPPDAYGPPPAGYGPPPGYYTPPPGYDAYQGPYARVNGGGWTGGVGYDADAGGGFVDGYGQTHFANGGGIQNGSTYNGYNQSFRTNATGMPGPFVSQRMGGAAHAFGARSGSR